MRGVVVWVWLPPLVLWACGGRLGADADGGSDDSLADDTADIPATGGSPSQASGGASSATGGALGEGGSPTPGCPATGARFATGFVEHAFGGGQNHNQAQGFPEALFGPPRANDSSSVVSLGNGGFVIVEFAGNAVVDGDGPDFVVFENPLPGFAELATIAVSDDLVTWHEFPCTAQAAGPDYGTCAGVARVFSTPKNGIDALDPDLAGGDWFDLADLGVARARWVRVTDRADLEGPSGVFDLDAVGIRNAECP